MTLRRVPWLLLGDYGDKVTVMGWTAPRPASMCAKMVVVTIHLREAVHEKVYQEFVRCHDDRARYREECVPGSWRRRRRRGGGGQIGITVTRPALPLSFALL